MKPTIKANQQTTYHRDGSVSFWNVYTQVWCRVDAADIADNILASMNDTERKRIAKMVEK